MDKLGAMLNIGGGAGGGTAAENDVPFLLRLAGRVCGIIGGVMAIIMGLSNCLWLVAIQVWCFLGGLWLMVAGFLLLVCEASWCCFFIDYAKTLSEKVDSRPLWNRAVFYVGLSIPPFLMCFGISTVFGSGLVFATGILYGIMALGKKASADEMRNTVAMEAGLSQPTSAPRSNLVANAQPISFTGVPVSKEPY